MKTIIIYIISVAAISALASADSNQWPLKRQTVSSVAWEEFKAQYGKSYATQEEETQRRANFESSMRLIRQHNAEENTFSLAINERADWSDQERARLLGLRLDSPMSRLSEAQRTLNERQKVEFLAELRRQDPSPVPASVDWRKDPTRVSEVRDQGYCGSCWAFATVGVLEGQQVKRLNSSSLVPLSVQELMDCSKKNFGCYGGLMSQALDDVAATGGIESEKDYPYMERDSICVFNKKRAVMTDAGHVSLVNITEVELAEVIAKSGPVAIGMYVTGKLFLYDGGVFSDTYCEQGKPAHAVLIVGYGTDPKQGDYWIVKNSWGDKWGEKGYIRLRRGTDECGVLDIPTTVKF